MKRTTMVLATLATMSGLGGASAMAQTDHDHIAPPQRPLTPMGKMLFDAMNPQPTPAPDQPEKDRAAAKNAPPGTLKTYHFWFGPYEVQPGSDAQRVDLGLPLDTGFVVSAEPRLRTMGMQTPSMLTGHIHHAHWFIQKGGELEWIFGNGDEGTRASFEVMNELDPEVNYGQFIDKDDKQILVYMLHNRTAKTQKWWVDLEVKFLFGTEEQLNAPALKAKRGGKEFRDLGTFLTGATFDVPRQAGGDGSWNSAEASTMKAAGLGIGLSTPNAEHLNSGIFGTPIDTSGPQEWVAPADGTIVEFGTHMHPGSTHALLENMGSRANPCPDDGRGTGGTLLVREDAINMHVPFSDDYQIEITQPGWRVPVHKGDRLRYTAFYANKDRAAPAAMNVVGMGIDFKRRPAADDRCRVYRVGPPIRVKDIRDLPGRGVVASDGTNEMVNSVMSFDGGWPATTRESLRWAARQRRAAARAATSGRGKPKGKTKVKRRRKVKDIGNLVIPITDGLPNRAWHHTTSPSCGEQYGARPCERPEARRPEGKPTDTVMIANFLYRPGDMSLPGQDGAPPRVRQGTSLRFVNVDGAALVRHSVTTCAWPCNGAYVTNYPFPDGVWESGTFGIDPLGDGMLVQQAETPRDLKVGKYAYFCRIHPWMRGAFEVVP